MSIDMIRDVAKSELGSVKTIEGKEIQITIAIKAYANLVLNKILESDGK